MAATPTIVPGVRANRRFPGRAVRYMAETGIRQFLDIGTGIPTANNTHEVAQSVAPAARVVYVDNDHCKSGCAHARGRSGCLRRTRGAGKNMSPGANGGAGKRVMNPPGPTQQSRAW